MSRTQTYTVHGHKVLKLPVKARGQRAVSRRINGQEHTAVVTTVSEQLFYLTKTNSRLSLSKENGGFREKPGS